jgi:hypothetical protein
VSVVVEGVDGRDRVEGMRVSVSSQPLEEAADDIRRKP